MLQNPTFWVAVAFVIFFALLWRAGSLAKVSRSLDERAVKIAKDLADAQSLRAEAENLMREYEAKRKSVESEAQAIIHSAKVDADRLSQETETKLNDFVKRRTAAAEAKIAVAETQAYADVRLAASNAAVAAVEIVLKKHISGKEGDKHINHAIKEAATHFN